MRTAHETKALTPEESKDWTDEQRAAYEKATRGLGMTDAERTAVGVQVALAQDAAVINQQGHRIRAAGQATPAEQKDLDDAVAALVPLTAAVQAARKEWEDRGKDRWKLLRGQEMYMGSHEDQDRFNAQLRAVEREAASAEIAAERAEVELAHGQKRVQRAQGAIYRQGGARQYLEMIKGGA